MIDDVIGTYELSSCYNVTIDCRAGDMIATVRSVHDAERNDTWNNDNLRNKLTI